MDRRLNAVLGIVLSGCTLPAYGTDVSASDGLVAPSSDAGGGTDSGTPSTDGTPDATGVAVNALPGSPYFAASCRGGADCAGTSAWGDAATIACVAPENAPHGTLTGAAQCWPIANDDVGVVLCLSGADCGGYACVVATCSVAAYDADGGEVGVVPVVVSYCEGLGVAPSGCN